MLIRMGEIAACAKTEADLATLRRAARESDGGGHAAKTMRRLMLGLSILDIVSSILLI